MDLKPLSSVAAAMLTFVAFTQYSVRDRSAEKVAGLIVTEFGQPLPSLFAGIMPDPAAREVGLTVTERGDCASQPQGEQSIARQFLNWINPPSVLASSCAESECGGHYMTEQFGPCVMSCDNGWLAFHYSNPTVPYDWGWKWTGQAVCNWCQCEESPCTNP